MTKAKTITAATIAYLLTIVATIASAALLPIAGAESPAPAPTPGRDCLTSLANMADCLSFVEDGSKLRKPDPACCPEISEMINTDPYCLCQLLANSSQFGLSDIDTNRALKVPTLCNISAPPVRWCAAIGVPVPSLSPTLSPAKSSGHQDSGSPMTSLSSSNLTGLADFVLHVCVLFVLLCIP